MKKIMTTIIPNLIIKNLKNKLNTYKPKPKSKAIKNILLKYARNKTRTYVNK